MTHGWAQKRCLENSRCNVNVHQLETPGNIQVCPVAFPKKRYGFSYVFHPRFLFYSQAMDRFVSLKPRLLEGNCDECESQRDDLHRSIQGELVPCFFFVRWKKWRSDDHPCVGIVKFKHLFIVFYSNTVVSDPLSIYVWLVVSNIFYFHPNLTNIVQMG